MGAQDGAAPAIEMAIVNSEVHRLREQLGEERSQWAGLRIEIRDRMDAAARNSAADALEVSKLTGRVSAAVRELDRISATLSGREGSPDGGIVGELHRARGAVNVLRWLCGCGLVLEVARTVLEHVKP